MGAGALFVAGANFMFGNAMSDEQRRLDKERIQLTYQDNLEKIRRRAFMQEATKGKAKARSETAGVRHTASSTPQGYMATITSEFKKELTWMKHYAETAKRLGMQQSALERKGRQMDLIKESADLAVSLWG
jgi:hypothetical protein